MKYATAFILTKRMKDLTDQKFGRLTAIKPVGRAKCGNIIWKCECDCTSPKKIHYANTGSLQSGHSKGCGCYRKKPTNLLNKCMAKTKLKRSSEYKGVSWNKQYNKWQVQITCKGIHYYLGRYHDEEFSAKIYNTKAIELFGEDAWLNPV